MALSQVDHLISTSLLLQYILEMIIFLGKTIFSCEVEYLGCYNDDYPYDLLANRGTQTYYIEECYELCTDIGMLDPFKLIISASV